MAEDLKRRFAELSKFAGAVEFGLWFMLVLALIGSVVLATQSGGNYGDENPYLAAAIASAVGSVITIVPIIVLMRAVNLWSLGKSDGYRPSANPQQGNTSDSAVSGFTGLPGRSFPTWSPKRDDDTPNDPKIQV